MLIRNEVAHATDIDLLTVILGNRRTAGMMLKKAGGSLFALLHAMPHQNGDPFCAQGASAYAPDPGMKLQAVPELALRASLRSRRTLIVPA